MDSKAFSWKLLLISDRILFTWVFLFLKPNLFYFNENKGNMFYVISLYNKIRYFEWRLFPRPSNLLALKRQILLMCVKKGQSSYLLITSITCTTCIIDTWCSDKYMMKYIINIFIFRFGACWQIIMQTRQVWYYDWQIIAKWQYSQCNYNMP